MMNLNFITRSSPPNNARKRVDLGVTNKQNIIPSSPISMSQTSSYSNSSNKLDSPSQDIRSRSLFSNEKQTMETPCRKNEKRKAFEDSDSDDDDDLRLFSLTKPKKQVKTKPEEDVVNKKRKFENDQVSIVPMTQMTQAVEVPTIPCCTLIESVESNNTKTALIELTEIDEQKLTDALNTSDCTLATLKDEELILSASQNSSVSIRIDNCVTETQQTPMVSHAENMSQAYHEDDMLELDINELDNVSTIISHNMEYSAADCGEPIGAEEHAQTIDTSMITEPKVMVDISTQTTIANVEVSKKPVHDPTNRCSICLNAWSSTGIHQICCLSCGHMFGKNCIEKWLKKNSNCPKCKKEANRTHIRLLYVDNVQAIDTQQLEDLQMQLENEIKARKELESIKCGLELRVKMLNEQLSPSSNTNSVENETETGKRKTLLQRSLELAERKKKEQQEMQSVGAQLLSEGRYSKQGQSKKRHYLYGNGSNPNTRQKLRIPIENGGVMDAQDLDNDAHISISFENKDKTCGFYHVNIQDMISKGYTSLNPFKRAIHNSPITDLKTHYLLKDTQQSAGYGKIYSSPHLILTSSKDKSMRITDTRQPTASTNSVCFYPHLSSITDYSAITSCEWNRSNDNYCFSGLSNGLVLCYDIRQPSAPFLSTGEKDSLKIHSLVHIPNKGLLVGNESSVRCFDENNSGYTKSFNLYSGYTSCLSFNPATDICHITTKDSPTNLIQFFKINNKLQSMFLQTLEIYSENLGHSSILSTFSRGKLQTAMIIPKVGDFAEVWKTNDGVALNFSHDIEVGKTETIQSSALTSVGAFMLGTNNLYCFEPLKD